MDFVLSFNLPLCQPGDENYYYHAFGKRFLFAFNWNYRHLLPIWYLEYKAFDIIGLVLIHVSLVWILIAQAGMGKSCRIGIDTDHNTELVTEGIFSKSRHPIFLGMLAGIVAIFLIIPNVISFSAIILSYFIRNIQIRLEEEFLANKHEHAMLFTGSRSGGGFKPDAYQCGAGKDYINSLE